MRLISFSYACKTLLLSPSAGADGIRLVRIFLKCTGSLPLSPSTGTTDGIRLVSVFLACETLLHGPSAGANSWACLHSRSRYALLPRGLTMLFRALPRLLSSSLSDSVCCSPSFPFVLSWLLLFISTTTIAASLATAPRRPPIPLLISTLEAAWPLISPTHSVGHTGATSLHI